MNNQSPVLAGRGLCKNFRIGNETLQVLKGVDFTLAGGESVAIVGTSGAGKTTLLSLLGGLEAPTSGEVRLLGEPLSSQSDGKRTSMRNRHIGFVYQLHHLLREFTAGENVQLPLLLGGARATEAREQAAAMLEKVGMGHRLAHKPAELSGGERQRVAIARALVNNPACVLLDEPTGNLDMRNAARIVELLLELCNRLATALVLVTHDQQLANQLDRKLHLVDGVLTS